MLYWVNGFGVGFRKGIHYGNLFDGKYGGFMSSRSRGWNGMSIWWRDLCLFLDVESQGYSDWLLNNIQKVVGDGKDTLFWLDNWFNNSPLKNSFKRLFSLTLNKKATIFDMREWREGLEVVFYLENVLVFVGRRIA
jgi:hypothetical protein